MPKRLMKKCGTNKRTCGKQRKYFVYVVADKNEDIFRKRLNSMTGNDGLFIMKKIK